MTRTPAESLDIYLAKQQAAQIEAYWRDLGKDVKAWVEVCELPCRPGKGYPENHFIVRTNLVNGLPQE